MLTYKRNSILQSSSHIIVCPVSSDGILSNKLTQKILQQNLPINLKSWQHLDFSKGNYHNLRTVNRKTICLFPTKKNHTDNDSYDYIVAGLKAYHDSMKDFEAIYNTPLNISFPQLGLDSEDWEDMEIIYEQYLDDLNQQVFVHINKGDKKLALDKRKR